MSKDLPKKGSNLLILREEKGLTQEDMAQFLGVSVKAYCNYEHGSQLPKSDLLPGWCEKLKVSADFILGLSDFRTPEADYIGKETGLREAAIKNLAADLYIIKSTGSSSVHLIDTLNYLASTQAGRDIVCTIYHYLFGNYTHTDADTDKMKLYDDTGIEANGAEISINDINSMFLFILNEKLTKAKKDIHIQGYGKFDPEADHTAVAYLWAHVMPLAPTNNTK